MSADLQPIDRAALAAWVIVLNRAKPDDRRLAVVLAISDLGNRELLRCAAHGLPQDRPMTFTAAYSHVTTAPSRCTLYGDQLPVVQS